MKKIFGSVLALVLVISLGACSASDVSNSKTATDNSTSGIATVTNSNSAASVDQSSASKPPVSKESTATQAVKEVVKVTIPEGYTFPQIAQKLVDSGVCDAKSFFDAAEAFQVKSFTVPDSDDRCYKLEGYLFPATYEFEKGENPEDVVRKMLNAYASNSGKPSDETLILASIIEKEVRSDEQMQMVSSVLRNRLNAGMKLQCDSTREYVNDNITGNSLLSSTEKFAALYNTYKCSALPAGPICNPGKRAINAAKSPAQSDYFYFFFGNDNQNHYSKTAEEHEQQKAQYGVNFG